MKDLKSIAFEKDTTLVGDMHFYRQQDILKDNNQKILSNWMILFDKRFSNQFENVKYLELRPKYFKEFET